jgi:hypothetical protein
VIARDDGAEPPAGCGGKNRHGIALDRVGVATALVLSIPLTASATIATSTVAQVAEFQAGASVLSGAEPRDGTAVICFTCFIEVAFAIPHGREPHRHRLILPIADRNVQPYTHT